MPTARLLLRETSTLCLSSVVAKALHVPPPHAEYTLRLTSDALELTETPVSDEGFESDLDSIISGGGGVDSSPARKCSGDSDSANGSTTSSDCEAEPSRKVPTERYDLVRCLCYDLSAHADLLAFVIKSTVFVYRFECVEQLRSFYGKFSALKALVASRKATLEGAAVKYSLMQRTDRNGVTHIEITNEKSRPMPHNQPPILVNSNKPMRKVVWMSNSAENLLEAKKPERRKKPPAPQPPVPPPVPSVPKEKKPLISLPAWTTMIKQSKKDRLLNFHQPMASRYIDATLPPMCHRHGNTLLTDRFFGLSPRIRDMGCHSDSKVNRWKSATDLTLRSRDAGLKSVIKKEEKMTNKSKEKKVTFSAYNTVQVV